ncbi:MAG: hypothetical protein A2270_01330 [Elusimicrobia bacterium RIFOXYA12_FULL_51_18]|nr:MAG: hypothetical protein A2270_01330 [Elusimicrobia bacterium RIFOXYA12_FULL_51_18]OGS30027.1 MAG: hypothetical protein A2218_12815 [Elusimicrobia bacterium RIFOXYA2_FULL_53_38]
MKKQLTIAAFLSALCTGGVYAQQYDEKYLTLDPSSAKIEAVDERDGGIDNIGYRPGPVIHPPIPSGDQLPKPPSGPVINPPIDPAAGASGGPSINETLNTIDQIVNLAEKIWNILDKNRPVVNITTNYANAVPSGTTHWTQLQGWKKPSTKKYAFSMKNGFGTEVVKVTYQVHWTHNGNLQGKGKFLTGVTVEPLNVVALWGYKVDLVAEVPDSTVANVGTHEDPIASMQVQLKWKVSTIIQSTDQKVIYYVQGDGLMQEIGKPFTKGMEEKSDRQLGELNWKLENLKF